MPYTVFLFRFNAIGGRADVDNRYVTISYIGMEEDFPFAKVGFKEYQSLI